MFTWHRFKGNVPRYRAGIKNNDKLTVKSGDSIITIMALVNYSVRRWPVIFNKN